MDLPTATRVAITQEGLEDLSDIVKFDEKILKQITNNLRCFRVRVPNPELNAAVGATILTPPFIFGAKIQLSLKAVFEIYLYYKRTNCSLSVTNMCWNPIIKTFTEHQKSLIAKNDATDPEVPNIFKNLLIMKWTEAFSDFACGVIGTQTISLRYVICETVVVPALSPPLIPNHTSSDEFVLVEVELIACDIHTHPLYRDLFLIIGSN